MKADYILKADILDIIFENKNKDYGAYALRKHYNERIYKALGIILSVALILGIIGFLYKHKTTVNFDNGGIVLGSYVVIPPTEPEAPQPPKPVQKQVAAAAPTSSLMNQVPIVADITSTKVEAPNEAGPVGPEGPGTNDIPPGTPGEGGETKSTDPPATPDPPKIDNKNPMRSPDVMPSYPGGIEQLKKFLKKNLVAPNELEPDETISVTIQFVVGYDGILKSFEIVEDGGDAFNKEVIRVIKKMPAWIPGKSQGENVSVYYSIPIKFTPTN